MKKILIILISLYALNKTSAQQNFFNVPSSDITPKKKVFFQQQVNALKGTLQSSSTLCYGLGHNFEIGANVLGVAFDEHKKSFSAEDTTKPYNPFFVFNLQKRWDVSNKFALALGGQFAATQQLDLGHYIYLNGVYKVHHTKIVGGLYETSDDYFGAEQRGFFKDAVEQKVGFQLGIEQAIIPERLVFQADFISGKHSLGEAIIGGAFNVSKHWIVSAGFQIPTFHSVSQKAAVFELTYVP
jgi:hypothetical protein